ncbi:PKD domain-containing protein [Dermatobacter hominis]|uniref:PKD domain-containing protein n=1 Tax=Dermatobacter hominis TaxID=2884263 RepID=UPI001D11772D|nr:PKD domain-containing protein [Dermatobacter hominis]UDY34034.1 PKD domain-containing protein [Dermatobacter hominis]
MTMLETLLALMLSVLMVVPVVGWSAVALRQQRDVVERNLSGASLGVLRTMFTRDVVNADRAWVVGAHLEDCRIDTEGARTLLVLVTGDRHTVYATVPDPAQDAAQLVRAQCPKAGTTALAQNELLADVVDAGTDATCETAEDLAALGSADPSARAKVAEERAAAAEEASKGATGGSAAATAGCTRVTLRLTTGQLDQVALTASRRAGGSLSAAPTAVATADPASGGRPLTVRFDGSASRDPLGESLSYHWDLGDGTTATGATATHQYVRTGPVVATLTVTTASGRTASTTVPISVGDNAPVAVIASPATGTKVARGKQVSFSSAGSGDPVDAPFGGRLVAYSWDFGDGTTSTEANPTKAYTTLSPATGYVVTLTVTDDAGQTATARVGVVVENRAPTVSLTASPSSGPTPLSVTFTAAVVDEPDMAGQPALRWAWDLGNGTTSTSASPGAVVYSNAGTYTAKVTVTDDAGATASATQVVTVSGAGPAAPVNLRKTNGGVEQGARYVEMAWDRRDGATRYEVQLTCVSCSEVATGQESGTTLRIRGLSNGAKDYDAQVRAMSSAGVWGPWSTPVRIKS